MGSLSKNIKERMAELEISAHALEKRAGLKTSSVQNIIYGRSKNPSISLISSIAKVLGCGIEDLIDDQSASSHLPAGDKPSSSSKSYKTFLQKTLSWDQTLYLKCFKLFYDLVEQRNIILQKGMILDLVDEIYNYSLGNSIQEPDQYFAKWLIDKHNQ